MATRWFSADIAQDAVNKAITQWLEHSPKHLQELSKWEGEQAQRMGHKLRRETEGAH